MLETPKLNTSALQKSLLGVYKYLFEFFELVARVFSSRNGSMMRQNRTSGSELFANLPYRGPPPTHHHRRLNVEAIRRTLSEYSAEDCYPPKDCKGRAAVGKYPRFTLHYWPGVRPSDVCSSRASASCWGDGWKVWPSRTMYERLSCLKKSVANQQIAMFTQSITRWINAGDFQDDFDQTQQERADGTNEWLFTHPSICSWKTLDMSQDRSSSSLASMRKEQQQLLWICGEPN